MRNIGVSDVIVEALLSRIAPDRLSHPSGWLPVVTGVDVAVEPLHRVAEHLVVDAAKPLRAACALDCLADEPEVGNSPRR